MVVVRLSALIETPRFRYLEQSSPKRQANKTLPQRNNMG